MNSEKGVHPVPFGRMKVVVHVLLKGRPLGDRSVTRLISARGEINI
jgi:hypothetical protein